MNNLQQIRKPVLGKLTQGTIFTGAEAEDYHGKPIWGLCITARCDMAHDTKTRVFSYLPIITFDAWMLKDGARLLAERLYLEFRASAANLLKNAKKSHTVLDSYSPDFISDSMMTGDASFRKIADKLTSVLKFRNLSTPTTEECKALASLNIKCAERLVKELWSLQLPGYYFLKQIGATEEECDAGYVILLREVHHLPYSLSQAIAQGIEIEDSNERKNYSLSNSSFDFACPTGLVASPWIEHIMQQFSLLFSRIGLPDPDLSHLTILNERFTSDN